MSRARVVGIDLGTTNTTLAWAEPVASAQPACMPISQLVASGQVEPRALLPSCLYAPADGEPSGDPFEDPPWVGGEHARTRGAESPGRSVISAKSWLSHPGVDREAAILPWASSDALAPRISPVDASARYLTHVSRAYEAAFPGRALRDERVVLTVPASFDEGARQLTLRAATLAGLQVTLLEEPLAAFYDYLEHDAELVALAAARGGCAHVLVCDIGGGTTDLSLVRVSCNAAAPAFERVAVGRHILLGGDNMDLALAHLVEPRLSSGAERLDPARFAQLVLACRRAKEALLGGAAPESMVISLLGRGSSLVGATLRASLSRDEVERVVLGGFFPTGELALQPAQARAGLAAFGLPYERDVAVTRHVCAFARRHAAAGVAVDALLGNGGVFRSPRVADRIAAALGGDVHVLQAADPDLAVSRGAVRYGLARLGLATRVNAGSARAYYIGLAGSSPPSAVCVLPKASQEGERHATEPGNVALVLGKAVRFDLYAADERPGDRPGDVVAIADVLTRLPPIAAQLGSARSGGEATPVQLEAELGATGTLAIACVETAGLLRRFELSFDLRAEPAPPAGTGRAQASASQLDEALRRVDCVFGKSTTAPPKELVRDLERALGPRSTWDAATSRLLFDAATRGLGARRRSAEHERTFFALVGACLRPGFGFPGDVARAALMAKLFAERLGFPDEARGWQQLFVAYRRVAGGLDEATQTSMRDLLDGVIAPREQKIARVKKFQPLAEGELLELAAALERVPAPRRAQLGEWLLERTWVSATPGLWASLGRIGSREPAYASAHHVVAPSVVERWLEHLLRANWDALATAPLAASRMARLTGDRSRDVSERVRTDACRKLERAGASEALIGPLRKVTATTDAERAEFFGEGLPSGLQRIG